MKLEAAIQLSMCGVVESEVPFRNPLPSLRIASGLKSDWTWEAGVGFAGGVVARLI